MILPSQIFTPLFSFNFTIKTETPICKHGPPEVDESGNQVFCGRGPTRQDCSPGYKCNIHPTDRYAVCCPVSESLLIQMKTARLLPNVNEAPCDHHNKFREHNIQYDSSRETRLVCTRRGHNPNRQTCIPYCITVIDRSRGNNAAQTCPYC